MINRLFAIAFVILGATALGAFAPNGVAGETKVHRIAFHVDENDPKRMNLVLNNAQNVKAYYDEKGEETHIEIVAYGPGLHMLRAESPVRDRIEAMSLADENLTFAACGNTHRKMSEQAGADVELLEEAEMVPSGVVRLVELDEAGWSYIRP